jgi:hypothetical protein
MLSHQGAGIGRDGHQQPHWDLLRLERRVKDTSVKPGGDSVHIRTGPCYMNRIYPSSVRSHSEQDVLLYLPI